MELFCIIEMYLLAIEDINLEVINLFDLGLRILNF